MRRVEAAGTAAPSALAAPLDWLSGCRYNQRQVMHMTIQQILREKGLSRYQLSKRSGIPWATLEAGTAVIDRRDLHALLLLVYQQTPVAVVPVEVAQKRIRNKHIPEEGAELIRGIQCLLIDSLQNGVQLLAVI